MATLKYDHPLVVAFAGAAQAGDTAALRTLLERYPDLPGMSAMDDRGGIRTALHLVTDWPGYYPEGPAFVRMLIAAGADPNARAGGMWHTETPLHWAASNDDSEAAEALIDGGADIEAVGGSIVGGTPLDNAVGYCCWNVARLLVQRGARVDKLWHAAALGLSTRLKELMVGDPPPTAELVNQAFWHACSGGQRGTAEYLLAQGADVNYVPRYSQLSALDAACAPDTRRSMLADWLKNRGAESASSASSSP